MATIKNEDFKIMIDVEDLLYKKLVKTNGIKEIYDGKEHYYFDENDPEYEIWVKYWNMVERFIMDKIKANNKSNQRNKKNVEYHRIVNNITSNRKNGNKERLEYWQNKLKEYKEREK